MRDLDNIYCSCIPLSVEGLNWILAVGGQVVCKDLPRICSGREIYTKLFGVSREICLLEAVPGF
jgi:hypothetical protein